MGSEQQLDRVVRSRRVVAGGAVGPAAVAIRDGRIETLLAFDAPLPPGTPLDDHGELLVMPGIVDTHVHVNEPGRTEWEGFESATRAAAAGGVTTLLDMPLNSIPPTTSLAGYERKLAAAEGKLWVDVGFWGGVVPGNAGELGALHEAGVFGFKCFLLPSGVEEFPHVDAAELGRAMPVLRELGSPLLVHAELPGPIEEAEARLAATGADPRRYRTFLDSRPRSAEDAAIAMMVRLCGEHRCRVHIVHLSSSDALPMLRTARDGEGLPITAETCLHYLHFAAEQVPDGATEFKCCPPIREQSNRERLWEGLQSGTIDLVISDHSPCTPDLKCRSSGDFLRAWGGIAGVQFGLGVLWTEARARGLGPEHVARWLCSAPARFAGLGARKGSIAPGLDADLVVWDPDAAVAVRPEGIRHRHPLTPYNGQSLYGRVEATYVRGRKVHERGRLVGGPAGACLRRKDA